MSEEALLGIDVGTSGVRACLFRPDGTLLGAGRVPCAVSRPRPGWAEVDPELWWRGFLEALAAARAEAGVAPAAIRGVGLSTLFPTLIPMDAAGDPLGPAILYCDQRSTAQAEGLRASGAAAVLEAKTSNRVAPGTFALTSLLWLRDEQPDLYRRAAWFGSVNALFSMRLAGVFCTDYSAGLLFGLVEARNPAAWSGDLAALVDVDPGKLPPLRAPGARVGEVTRQGARLTGLAEGTPVAAGAGDAAAAPFGGGCTAPGDLLYTTGSSDCLSCVIGAPQTSRLFPNPGYLGADTWLSVGTSTSTGAAVDWFAEQFLGEASGAAVARAAEGAAPGARGVTFLPYLQGERTPVWDADARGAFTGLSMGSTRADLARAVLEGTAFALRQIVEAMEREGGVAIPRLPTCGGGAKNALWNRIKADVTGKPLDVFTFQEFSALGAAMLGGTAAGVYASAQEAVECTQSVRATEPVEPDPRAREAYEEPFRRYAALYPALSRALTP
jgi:xylulokinase